MSFCLSGDDHPNNWLTIKNRAMATCQAIISFSQEVMCR